MKRSPMKRSRPAWVRVEKPERVYRMPAVNAAAFRMPELVASTVEAVAKQGVTRSARYRRAVASLPCIHCGVWGYSQCAHANTDKGAAIKTDDTDSFPLCTVHPGADGQLVAGCHEQFDQGALFTKAVRRALEPTWVADTQRRVFALGLWPAKLALTPVVQAMKSTDKGVSP